MTVLKYWNGSAYAAIPAQGPQGPIGPTGLIGPVGPTGPQGSPGAGLPPDGYLGYILAKEDASPYNSKWIKPPGGKTTILNGEGAPADSVGGPGEYYVDVGGNIMYGPKIELEPSWPAVYLIGDTTIPGDNNSVSGLTIGDQWNILVPGQITGLRFFRIAADPALTRQLRLYDGYENLLAMSDPTIEAVGSSGWKEVTLPEPVIVTPGNYVICCDARYWGEKSGGPTQPTPEHATWVMGRHGALGTFPGSGASSCRFYDLFFAPDGAIPPDPWPIAIDGGAGGGVSGGHITISATPPASPGVNDVWIDTT